MHRLSLSPIDLIVWITASSSPLAENAVLEEMTIVLMFRVTVRSGSRSGQGQGQGHLVGNASKGALMQSSFLRTTSSALLEHARIPHLTLKDPRMLGWTLASPSSALPCRSRRPVLAPVLA